MTTPTPSKEYPVSLPLEAVEAMCEDKDIDYLLKDYGQHPRAAILTIHDNHFYYSEPIPDWVHAALNCKDDSMILPVAIHTFLVDWRQE